MKSVERVITGNKRRTDLAGRIVRVSYKLFGGDRMTLDYGTDVQIHGAEIHMICHIMANPGSYISEIARDLNVTRGAVSQLVGELTRKGLVEKREDPEHAKRKTLTLTEKGMTAFRAHQKLHAKFDREVDSVSAGFSRAELEVVERFYRELEGGVDRLIQSL